MVLAGTLPGMGTQAMPVFGSASSGSWRDWTGPLAEGFRRSGPGADVRAAIAHRRATKSAGEYSLPEGLGQAAGTVATGTPAEMRVRAALFRRPGGDDSDADRVGGVFLDARLFCTRTKSSSAGNIQACAVGSITDRNRRSRSIA